MVQWGKRFSAALDQPLLIIYATTNEQSADPKLIPLRTDEGATSSANGVGLTAAIRRALTATAGSREIAPASEEGVDPTKEAEASESAERDEASLDDVSYFRLGGPRGMDEVLQHLGEWSIDLLLLPAEALDDQPCELFSGAPCETMLIKTRGSDGADSTAPIVTPTNGRSHDHGALQLAATLADHEHREAHATYVNHGSDEYAMIVGLRTAERLASLAAPHPSEVVQPRSAVNAKVDQGIREVAEQSQASLILAGVRPPRAQSRQLPSLVSKLLKWEDGPSVAVLRPAMPLHHRFLHLMERWLEDRLPQLTRNERVELVERIQKGSEFNVDFMALICLSTLIAALGLARDQAAVVIGAMLVAPLMTPLMGFGLSLMQGNASLAKDSVKSVLGGFTLALLIGIAVGLLVVRLEPSAEMQGRGSPGVLDLLVAFVSGMAAAYASGRPNLSSALPGVAIAAALVPPIATAGMSMALGESRLAGGALLLFLTNIVAIVLGAAVGLWAVGIRSRHQHGGYESWSGWVVTILVLVLAGLAVFESQPGMSFASISPSLELNLERAVHQHEPTAHIDFKNSTLQRSHGATHAELRIHSRQLLPQRLAHELHQLLLPHVKAPLELQMSTQLTTNVAGTEQEAGP